MTKLPRRLLTSLTLVAILGLALPKATRAHAFLVRTTPQAGERLAAAPSGVSLQFSEPVVAGSEQIAVRVADGKPVAVGSVQRDRGGTLLRAGLPQVDKAIYVVSWRVLAADGHLAAGEFAFAVGAGGRLPVAATTVSGTISWPDAVASGLFHTGLALAVGGLLSEAAVWRPIARRRGLVVPLAPVAPGLLLALLGAALQFALLAGAQSTSVGNASSWATAFVTRPGLLTVGQLVFVAYGLWILRVRRLRPWSLLPLAGAVAAAAFRGHSGSSGEWWAAPANALHLALAAFWVGALLHLVLVLRRPGGEGLRPALREAARRYATLALILVPPLLVAGVVTALAEFSQPAELIETTYGRVLLLKLLFVVAALALALVARLRVLLAQPRRLDLLHRLTGAEGVVLVAVLAITAVLVSAAPPRTAAAEAELLGPAPLDDPVVRLASLAGQLAVYLAAANGELQLRVLAPGGSPAEGALVEVQGRSPSGAGLDLYPRSCGRGCFTMGFPWQEGTTRLTTTVSSKDWTGGVLDFSVPWPPEPEDPELLRRVVETMREQRGIQLTERVSSGPGATAGPYPARFTGPRFVAQEIYAAGGASDIRPVPSDQNLRALTAYVSGSAIWYRLEIDPQDRLRSETIVNPGHIIERTFTYDGHAEPLPVPGQP
ncbi:MAG TPA: copper resistance protein CopC [Chloroflexota bacterium]|nr:copper resistance protein CopC [Chloroflexota bacterium]